ncbi:MAG: hypothetical protein PHI39_02820 [Kiritimatiellae bacterium]|nr:hypothetical protein [Kiritimatiellia bacterium]
MSRLSGQAILYQAHFVPTPKSHQKYWAEKFARNEANDRRHVRRLRRLGWRVIIVWECQLEKHPDTVLTRLQRFLNSRSTVSSQRTKITEILPTRDSSWPE